MRLCGLRNRLCGGGSSSGRGHSCGHQRTVCSHHPIGLHDLGVGRVPVGPQLIGQGAQLELGQLEPHLDPLALLLGSAGDHRIAPRLRPGAPHRGTRRGGMAADRQLVHGAAATARSSAATMIEAEVAPGSW